MQKYLVNVTRSLFVLLCFNSFAVAAEWQELSNGSNLDGWRKVGGTANYSVIDGAIVGSAVPGSPNTFLVTEQDYDDFIFEGEVKSTGGLNSGIQFRSAVDPAVNGGRVFGYQMEVDPGERQWSGGIYEEGRRGWLYNLTRNPACQKAFINDGWNHYRIEAVGQRIRTWVNKVPCADLLDDGNRHGFIALQVHSIAAAEQAGSSVSLRNPRILTGDIAAHQWPMPDSVVEINYLPNQLSERQQQEGWKLLWDGASTAGWRGAKLAGFPSRGWGIENGELIVYSSGGGEARNGGDIITTGEYSDFELELDFMITEGANSGIKYFVDPDLLQGEGSAIGLEFQILDDERHPDAKLGQGGNRTIGSLYDLIPAENLSEAGRTLKRVNPPGQWNRARVRVSGMHVEHWLNDIKVVEFERGNQVFRALVQKSKYAGWPNFGAWDSGPILLQDHGDRVHFRSIKIRDLSGEHTTPLDAERPDPGQT